MESNTVSFFGHRKITVTTALQTAVHEVIEDLIINKKADTFLFGSRSEFDDLCHATVTTLRKKHPHIKRIYVRAEFPHIDETYRAYLLEKYEDTFFPAGLEKAGRAIYIERNMEMVRKSRYCVMYYDKDDLPSERNTLYGDGSKYRPKSGTAQIYRYAIKAGKEVMNIKERGV